MRGHAASALLLTLVGCASVPGDPNTVVVDGEPLAGYAWSGPNGYRHGFNDKVYVAWSIWFTNTDYCPSRTNDYIAGLSIISPELVDPPSTALPTLASMTIPIVPLFSGTEIIEPIAAFGSPDLDGGFGTLTLTSYDAETIAGEFETTASGFDSDYRELEVRGAFTARRCDRIHD